MGEVKFIFFNWYNVYIYDMIECDQFVCICRDFFVGCIWVEDLMELVCWIFVGQDGYDVEEIVWVIVGNLLIVVWLDEWIWVYIVYWIVVGDENGDVCFFNDFYGCDFDFVSVY